MDSAKIAFAIAFAGAAIAASIYFGITEERREFIIQCTQYMTRSGTTYNDALYYCTVQYSK